MFDQSLTFIMNNGLTKDRLAEKVASKLSIPKREALTYVETVLETVKSTLETGEKVKIAGFGNFEVKQKKDRIGRNPQTGESITIKSRRVLSFKPSTLLKTAINTEK